jgi:hypothetical protein
MPPSSPVAGTRRSSEGNVGRVLDQPARKRQPYNGRATAMVALDSFNAISDLPAPFPHGPHSPNQPGAEEQQRGGFGHGRGRRSAFEPERQVPGRF